MVLAGRNLETLQATENAIKAETPDANTRLLIIDLSSQESVRRAAAEVNNYPERLDHLINNAGIMAAPYSTTPEGVELQFGINHIGHFLFTNLLLEKIMSGESKVRVVNVSSAGHKRGPVRFGDVNFEVCAVPWFILSFGCTRAREI